MRWTTSLQPSGDQIKQFQQDRSRRRRCEVSIKGIYSQRGVCFSGEKLESQLCSLGLLPSGSKRSHKTGGTTAREALHAQRTKRVVCLYELTIRAYGSGLWVVKDLHSMHLKLPGSATGALPSARRHLKQQYDVETAIQEGHAVMSVCARSCYR